MSLTLQQIYELDKKRTQGEWSWNWVAATDVDYSVHCGYATIAELKNRQGVHGNDFAFIAAAPEMVRLLREQQSRLAEAEGVIGKMTGALETLNSRPIATWYSIRHCERGGELGYYAGWDDAEYQVKQALAAANEYNKLQGE